jgi:uncharacterized membrane protein
MRSKDFLNQLDHQQIVAAIAASEAKTSGEIRVFVRRGELADDPLIVAQQEFSKLGMERTAERNGILILVAPRAQKFAVVGDEGVHVKCGAEFWEKLVAIMGEHFKRAAFTDALVEAIESAGTLLAAHFPRRRQDRNELPDEIIEG